MTQPGAPLDEYAPLLAQVESLFDERDALLRLMRCHLCPSPPIYRAGDGRWTCFPCWQRTKDAA